MDDFNNLNKNEGEINGFDSVNENPNNGYTVTPEGGFYTKQRDDIIQDEPVASEPEPAYQAQPEPQPSSDSFYTATQYNAYNPYYKPPKPKREKRQKRYGGGVVAVAIILAVVVGALSGAFTAVIVSKNNTANTVPQVGGNNTNVSINIDETAESVVEAVATKVTPSVVGIRTTTSVMSFFGGSSEASGEGSGVVYTSDGYIITNYHVISEATTNKSSSKIEVFLDSADSEAYTATVVGYNISADLAVIKINVSGLTPIEIGDSEKLKVGQYVITVGNPGGLEFMDSVTYGVISGLNRVVSSDSGVELIQTDAAINPGNSGGALVNVKGQLVGINSSKIVSEEFEGMGFAIPSKTVISICDNIISKENSPEPYVGISLSEKYTASVLKYYGFPTGAVVLSVYDGSPADKAGIERGDIITEFDGTAIKDYTVLENLIQNSTPGDNVTVKLYRSGRYYSTTITIGSNNQVG